MNSFENCQLTYIGTGIVYVLYTWLIEDYLKYSWIILGYKGEFILAIMLIILMIVGDYDTFISGLQKDISSGRDLEEWNNCY